MRRQVFDPTQPLRAAAGIAAAAGLALQLALMLLPDPGLGPRGSGLLELDASVHGALGLWAANVQVLAALTLVALGVWWLWHRTGDVAGAAVVLAVLVGGWWLHFVSGVAGLADALGQARPALLAEAVHGYLEFPALLLPMGAAVVAVRGRAPSGWRLIAVAGSIGAAVLLAAAFVEAYAVPGLL